MAEDLLSRSLKLLQGAIRASGYTQTEVDDLIGRRRGYLSHVFQRRVDLKLIDLLRALAVLGIEPRRFFATLVANGGGSKAGVLQLIAERLDRQTEAPAPGPQETDGDDPELEERVRKALRSILLQMGRRSAATG